MRATKSDLSPKLLPERRWFIGTLALGTWICTTACSGTPSGQTKTPSHSGGLIVQNGTGEECRAMVAIEPLLEPAEAAKVPISTLTIHSHVPLSRIHARIAGQIPRVLASEKDRPVGAPGLATFKVTRGSPSLEEQGERLFLEVPISAEISVCKPIGSGCFTYGSCSPQLEASFSISNHLGPNYFLAPPQGSIHATKRCVIGLDVTSQIETIAKSEVKKVESQIRSQWPDLQKVVDEAWQSFRDPLALVDDACFHFTPQKLAYVPPKIKTSSEPGNKGQKVKILRTAIQLKGTVSSTSSCNSETTVPPLSDPAMVTSLPEKSKLWVPELLDFDAVKASLASQITGPSTAADAQLELLDMRLGSKRIALLVKATGALCGEAWISANLAHVTGSSALSFEDWAIAKEEGRRDEPNSAGELLLLEQVQKRVNIPLRSAGWFSEDQADRLRSELALNLPRGLGFELKSLRASNARVIGTSEGILLLHPLSAQLLVNDL